MSEVTPGADFLTAHASILVFLATVVGGLLFALVLWAALRPSRHSDEKLTIYECGENPVGNAWVQFNIRFYVFALIFVVFDVEAVFLLPWATVFRELGPLIAVTGGGGARLELGDQRQFGITLSGDVVYTRFLDHLFVKQRFGYFGALGFDAEIE